MEAKTINQYFYVASGNNSSIKSVNSVNKPTEQFLRDKIFELEEKLRQSEEKLFEITTENNELKKDLDWAIKELVIKDLLLKVNYDEGEDV